MLQCLSPMQSRKLHLCSTICLTILLVILATGSMALLLTVSASGVFAGNVKNGRLAITTTSLPNGQVGVAYTATLAATGGTLPYRWSLTSGTLPSSGLSLNVS